MPLEAMPPGASRDDVDDVIGTTRLIVTVGREDGSDARPLSNLQVALPRAGRGGASGGPRPALSCEAGASARNSERRDLLGTMFAGIAAIYQRTSAASPPRSAIGSGTTRTLTRSNANSVRDTAMELAHARYHPRKACEG